MDNFTDIIQDNGIVGAGGAGFPTHVKLNTKADTVIVNGAECEPLLRVDQQLMAVRAKDLLEGLSMIMEQVSAKEGVIALKKHYAEADAAISGLLDKYKNIRIFHLGEFYPAGDEQVLVYEVTGRIVPEGGIPIAVGAVVDNVETVLNIYDAVKGGKPVTDSYVTLTGCVKQKKTVKVPIGITVKEALALAGGPTVDDYAVINGGPMMGRIVRDNDLITKTTKGLIVLPADHSLIVSLTKPLDNMMKLARSACMHCSLCTEVCPRNLLGHRIEPNKMIRFASYQSFCDSSITPMNAYLCCGCRLCEYACVMDLQPWKLHNAFKSQMGAAGIKNELHDQPEHANPFREYRRYPVKKLIARLGITAYDEPAPLEECRKNFGKVTILLKQHVGAPASPVVNAGDTVKKGDVVARMNEGQLGASYHASISGKVVSTDNGQIVIEK
ncbi:MAG: SLBB domain-containing protein [Eubacteriaceae bacterium]|jgi:Na+-translocating ferredoxin:NAD+ oxidoreductase RnfC subunit|nr:SLBB domain-containing protein [Eubacteriaceae bacterium]